MLNMSNISNKLSNINYVNKLLRVKYYSCSNFSNNSSIIKGKEKEEYKVIER